MSSLHDSAHGGIGIPRPPPLPPLGKRRAHKRSQWRSVFLSILVAFTVLVLVRPHGPSHLIREPVASCTPLSTAIDGARALRVREIIEKMQPYMHEWDVLTATQVGHSACLFLLRLSPSLSTGGSAMLALNPVRVEDTLLRRHMDCSSPSAANSIVEERDPSCLTEARFERSNKLLLSYEDEAGNRHLTCFRGTHAHHVAHALDVLQGYSLCY